MISDIKNHGNSAVNDSPLQTVELASFYRTVEMCMTFSVAS